MKRWLALILAGIMACGNLPAAGFTLQTEAAESVTGTLSVSFENTYAEAGKPLEAEVTKVSAADTLRYEWLVDGVLVSHDSTYTPSEEQLNSWIELVVSDGSDIVSGKLYYSKLPVVYIDTEGGQTITSKENYIDASLRVQGNAEFDNSKQLYNGVTEIRGRGNSTWAQPKKPYRLKLDKKTDMFGMGEGEKSKHWVLLANYLDESLLRNTLAYDMSGEMGMEHLSTVWVEVVMNGEHVGNYQFCENIRVDEDRVDIFDWESFCEDAAAVIAEAEGMDEDTTDDLTTYMAEESMQWITSKTFTFNGKTYNLANYEEGILTLTEEDYGYTLNSVDELKNLITVGYILELDEYYDEVSRFKTNSSQPMMFKNPEYVYTNTDMFNYVQNYVQAFEDAVQSDDYTAEYEGETLHYSELYDFDALIDYWLVTEIFYNEEINKKSTYMYKDVDGLMIMGPIWDMDWSSGAGGTSAGATDQWATNRFNVNAQANQWYKDLVKDPYFLMKAQERYWEIRGGQVQDMLDLVDVHIDYLKESGQADYDVWKAKAGRGTSFASDSSNLKNWLNTHVTWMDGQMETEDSITSAFFAPSKNLTLTVLDKEGNPAVADVAEVAPADALLGTTDDATVKIEGTDLSGNAQIFVNGKAAGTIELKNGSAQYGIAAALLTEEVDEKNIIEVKVRDNAGDVTAENYVTVKRTDCVHSYQESWSADEEYHWNVCTKGCGYETGKSKHNFQWSIDREATKEEVGLKHEECTVCEYKRNENTEFEYVEAPADPSDDSKDISVKNMVAIAKSECACSNTEGSKDFVLDGNPASYWHTLHGATAEGTYLENRWVGVSLNEATQVNGIRFLPRSGNGNGQVSEYEVQYRTTDDGEWIKVAEGTWDPADGNWKYVGFPSVTAKQVRIVGVHTVSQGQTDRHMTCAEFRVTGVDINAPEPTVVPSVEPTEAPEVNDSADIPVSMMSATAGNAHGSDVPGNVLDDVESTVWHTDWAGTEDYKDHWLLFELKEVCKVDGLRYLPRTDKSVNGDITEYEIYTSLDGNTWELAVAGKWDANKEWKSVAFTETEAKYVKFVSIDALSDSGKIFSSAAEVRLTGTVDGEVVVPPTDEATVSFENGYAEVGKALTVSSNAEKINTYKWIVDGKEVSTESTYTPTAEDLEKWIQVDVTTDLGAASAKMYCSKLPVVYIDTEGGQPITSKEKYIDADIKIQGNETFNESKELYDGVTEIRGRGNSTWSQPKKPYRLKLDKKTDIFGMGKSKHWVLLANYLDESLMRNTLAYNLSGSMGMEQMSTVWVSVIMNGEYAGNYQLCENIRVDDTRVDIFDWETFAEDVAAIIAEAEGMDEDTADDLATYMAEESMQWITSKTVTFNGKIYNLEDYEKAILELLAEDYGHELPNVDHLFDLINGGYILELDEYYDEVSKFKTNSNQPIMFKNPEFVNTNSDMIGFVQEYVQAFEDAVHNFDYKVKYDGDDVHYSELYDMDALVDYWLITEIFFNEEINKKSTYMYKGVDELMKMGPIWDMDWSSGGEGDTKHTNRWATLHFNAGAQAANWYKDLVKDPYFLMKAQERYWEIRDLQVQDMLDVMDDHYELLKESGAADGTRWGKGNQSFKNDYEKLNTWLNTHITWMDGQMATEDGFDASFLNKDDSFEVRLTTADGTALPKDTEGKVPADVFAANTEELKLELSKLNSNAYVFINGKSYTIFSDATVKYIPMDQLIPGEKNVIEVKDVTDSGEVLSANYITVRTEKAPEPTVTEAPEPTVTEEPKPSVTEAPEPTETEAPQPTETPEDKKTVTEIFTDVYKDWYTDYVQYVYDNGLMTGIKGTTKFQPNANITKAQVAQVLYNMENQPAIDSIQVFTDLKDVYASEWYADAVAWAYGTGVVTGDLNAKKFFPNADVTREQLALMMYRYADYKGYDVKTSCNLEGLKNAENTSNWALAGVKWAVGEGLISGIEKDGVKDLAPQGNATRAQVAAILQRFCEAYK